MGRYRPICRTYILIWLAFTYRRTIFIERILFADI